MAFHLMRTNRAGYTMAYCTDGDFHGYELVKFPGQRTLYRSPTIKEWKTKAGVERWMAERPGFTAEIKTR